MVLQDLGQPSDTAGGARHGVESQSGVASGSASEGLLSISPFTSVPLGDQNCVFNQNCLIIIDICVMLSILLITYFLMK